MREQISLFIDARFRSAHRHLHSLNKIIQRMLVDPIAELNKAYKSILGIDYDVVKKSEHTVYVRLKPVDPDAGYVREAFTLPDGLRFKTGVVHQVSAELAGFLARVKQVDFDSDDPCAFDIWYSQEDAKSVLIAEQMGERRKVKPGLDSKENGE